MDNQNTRWPQAALLLACGHSATKTAVMVGVDRKTIAAWQQDAAFAKLVAAESSRFIRECRTTIRGLRDKSLETLEAILDGDNDAARARVAIAILTSLGALGEPEKVIDPVGNKIIKIQFVQPRAYELPEPHKK